jgi:hypothetical protein
MREVRHSMRAVLYGANDLSLRTESWCIPAWLGCQGRASGAGNSSNGSHLKKENAMVMIETIGDRRVYRVPQALHAVAAKLFPADVNAGPIFSLARRLSADDLHTCEQIATNTGHEQALDFARAKMRTH